MKRASVQPGLSLWAGKAIALLALLYAPALAQASCGDHVLLTNTAEPSARPGQERHRPPPAHCQGPACSRPPSTLPAPPPPPVTEPPLAALTLCSPVRAGTGQGRLADLRSVPPSRLPSDIFHPPRRS